MTGTDNTIGKNADPVSAVHTRERELDDTILNLSKGAEAGEVVAGHAARGTAPTAGGQDSRSKREKDGQALTQAVLDQIALIEEQLAGLYDQRDALIKKLNDIEHQQSHWVAVQGQLSRGNLPEIEEDGTLSDEKLESLVAAYEERTGHAVDRTNAASLMSIIAAEQARLDDAYQTSRNDLEALNEKIDELEQRSEALQNGRELDAVVETGLSANADLRSVDDISEPAGDHLIAQNRLDQFTF